MTKPKKPKFWMVWIKEKDDRKIIPYQFKSIKEATEEIERLLGSNPEHTITILEAIQEFRGNVVVEGEELG